MFFSDFRCDSLFIKITPSKNKKLLLRKMFEKTFVLQSIAYFNVIGVFSS